MGKENAFSFELQLMNACFFVRMKTVIVTFWLHVYKHGKLPRRRSPAMKSSIDNLHHHIMTDCVEQRIILDTDVITWFYMYRAWRCFFI